MDADFWHQRWQRREIGFHREEVHPFLQRYFPGLEIEQGARVLVPLCGKSLDMLWLCQQGYLVVGIELNRSAVEEFFAENRLVAEISQVDEFSLYQVDQLQIYCGDFFALAPQQIGEIAAIYDRAALVALPPQMRPAYAAHLSSFLPAGGQVLTISYDYPQDQMSGPPFSVPQGEIETLFSEKFQIHQLQSEATLGMHKKMQAAGLRRLQEEVYQLRNLTDP